MKSLRRMARLAAVGVVMALCASQALAQNYYSLQHTNWPPLPFLPFEVKVFDLGDGFLAYDDLAVDYGQEAMMESGPPEPGEGGGTNEVYNGPWLIAATRPTICGSRLSA